MGDTESKLKCKGDTLITQKLEIEKPSGDRLPSCEGNDHLIKDSVFECMTPGCKQTICENCAPAPDIKN